MNASPDENHEPDGPELSLLYDDFKREHLTPLWTQIDDLMPVHPDAAGGAARLAVGRRCYPLAERSGDLVPVGRGGERRAIAPGQPRPARHRLRHADALGGDPVPRAAGDRARAPAHPERVPLRRRGRGCLDRRQRRPGRDAPRRLPADPGLELPWPPQRHRPADGLDRRAGHPVRRTTPTSGSSSSAPSGSPTRPRRTSPAPNGSGATRACGRCPACRTPVSSPIGAYRWEHTDRALTEQLCWRTRATRPPSSRATPRSATSTRPPAAT